MERPGWLPYALVAIVACAVHLPTLGFDFVFDDEILVVNNTFLRQDDILLAAFRHHFWYGTFSGAGYYRPIVVASLALNGRLLGWNPPSFHFINILLHAANAVLLLALARRLGARPVAATCAALFFAVHPVAAWPVASVVARVDLLPALFILLSWHSLATQSVIRADSGAGPPAPASSWWTAGLAGALFLLALLCKESAVAFLCVPLLGLVRFRPGGAGGTAGAAGLAVTNWRPIVTTCASLLVYAGLRSNAGVPLLLRQEFILPTNPLALLPAGTRLWAALELSGRYLLHLFLPIRFTDSRDYVSGPLPGPVSLGGLLSLALLLAWALTVTWLWLRSSAVALPLGFSLASFLPASNILVPIGSLYAQNFLYLPLLGLSLAAGLGFGRLLAPSAHPKASNRPRLLVAGSLLLLLALATVREASIWRDALTLSSAWTRRFPHYAVAHEWLGEARFDAGEAEAAERSFRRAIQLDDRSAQAHYNLGVCLKLAARDRTALEEALQETEKALMLSPRFVDAYINASHLLRLLGRPAEAEARARQALELIPGFLPARLNLAEAVLQQERIGEAALLLEDLAREWPADASVRSSYVVALLLSGDLAAARRGIEEARRAFPGLAWFDFCLARVEIREGHSEQALALLQVALDKDPATRDWLDHVDDFGSLRGRSSFEAMRRPAGQPDEKSHQALE